jgi:hypothetical protein
VFFINEAETLRQRLDLHFAPICLLSAFPSMSCVKSGIEEHITAWMQ